MPSRLKCSKKNSHLTEEERSQGDIALDNLEEENEGMKN